MFKKDQDSHLQVYRNFKTELLSFQSVTEVPVDGLYHLGKALKALPSLKRVHLHFEM